MDESSVCLVRSLSQPSPTSQDSKEGDAIRRALTSSISFGRFMTEPLVWEKWSAFTHDRYLEDAKKYSKPGSVAEKKAYFEAHFKRIVAMKAAGSVVDQNTAVNNVSESNAMNEIDEEHTVEKQRDESRVASAEDQVEKQVTAVVATTENGFLAKRETTAAHIKEVAGGSEQEPSFMEKHVESSIQSKDVQWTSVNKDVISPVEDAMTTRVPASSDKKIPTSSPLKSAVVSTVKPIVKRETPIPPKIDGLAMANSKKTTKSYADKNRSAPKSLHMSINFSSHPADAKKTSSPLLQRIANSKFVTNFTKTSKESTNQHTHTRVSTNASVKNIPAAPQPNHGRTKVSLLRQSVAEMITGSRKPKTSPMPSRPSSTTHGTKERCPVVSPPFSLKSEERAAKRKEFFEKIEEKRKAQEAEKEKLQGKPKGKTRNVFEDRQPLFSQAAKTNTSIDLGIKSSKVPAKKISNSQPCSPMISSKKQSTESNHNARPPWRHALKTDNIKDNLQKNNLPPTNSNKSLPKKSTRENAPPNILH